MLLDPPPSQTVIPSRTPSPLERDVFYGRPLCLVSDHSGQSCRLMPGRLAAFTSVREAKSQQKDRCKFCFVFKGSESDEEQLSNEWRNNIELDDNDYALLEDLESLR